MARRITFLLLFGLIIIANVFAQAERQIGYNESRIDTISNDDPIHEWTFSGSAGDTVSIFMDANAADAGGLDSFLQLSAPDGAIIATNDDADGFTVNAAIIDVTLPADGDYTIIASRFGQESGFSEGEYTLTLNTDGATPPTNTDSAPATATDDTRITAGNAVTGSLNADNFEDEWTFDGSEGDTISIIMRRAEASSLDSYLLLLDDSGAILAENDDGLEGIASAEIRDFALPYSGTYTIVATRFGFQNGTSSGDYELELSIAGDVSAQPETPPETDSQNDDPHGGSVIIVEYDTFSEGSLAGDESVLYSFIGNAGDVITISVKQRDGDFDPIIQLTTMDDIVLQENSTFNGEADARIVDFVLPDTAGYKLTIASENGEGGTYELHIFATDNIPVPENGADA